MVGVFDIYKINGVIDGFDGENINISEEKGWPEELIIKNCPNLTYIYCSSLGSDLEKLKKITIENCPNLTYLEASNNYIKEVNLSTGNNKLETIFFSNNYLSNFDALDFPCESIKNLDINANQMTCADLTECKNLEILNCGVNKLSSLDLTHCSKLKKLYCYKNSIKDLQVKKLKHLEELYCQSNLLEELDCSGLKNLKDLYCFCNTFVESNNRFIGLKKLNVKGCESLEILDCAENSLEKLELDKHHKLDTLSCKENCLTDLTIKNCPNLIYVNFSLQGFFELFKENEREIKVSCEGEEIPSKLLIDIKSRANLTELYYTQGAEFINAGKKKKNSFNSLTEKDFPNLKNFARSLGETACFEEHIDENRQAEWEKKNLHQPDEGYYETSDDIPLCRYKIPTYKNIIDYHDISHRRLTGKLIIEDWPNLVSLNVGDNRLQALVVKNCPNLTILRYSHNAMPKEAEVSGCDNLAKTDNYLYDEFVDKTEAPISEEEQAYIEEQERKEREQEDEGYQSEEDDKINHEITLEYLESLTYEELVSLDPESVPRYLAINVISLLKKKFIEQIKQQGREKEALKKVAGLIVEAQQALKENNLSELKTILDEMKNYCDTDAYVNNKELIAKLEQQLINATSQSELNNKTPNLPLIIGLSLVSIGILVLVLKFLQNKLKKMLKFR